MSYETIETKKFINSVGVGHLWDKIRDRYDKKLESVAAKDDSITVSNLREIQVQISSELDNQIQLKTTGNKGLYVPAPAAADTYAITKDASSGEYAAVYRLKRYTNGVGAGVDAGIINIPKDMVVQSGTVETKDSAGDWGNAGTYIHIVLANADNSDIYIPVDGLIEYVTSGSQTGDMIIINVDESHRVTASITDDSITSAKLTPSIRAQLTKADNSVQSVTTGTTNGTISVDGTEVAVAGLGTAAYTSSTAYDAAGEAAAVLGADSDQASVATVYGVKRYASDAYAAIQALSNNEIDAAIVAANTVIDGSGS